MKNPTIEYLTYDPTVRRYKYLWLKYVEGVNLEEHCQKALLGLTSRKIGTRQISGAQRPVEFTDIHLNESRAGVYYFCGVTDPYVWEHNFHLAFRRAEGERIVYGWPGLALSIVNAEAVDIDPNQMDKSHRRYRQDWYRTCRNAQFAWGFANGLYGSTEPIEDPALF